MPDLTGEGEGVRGVILHSFLEGDGEPNGGVEADLSSPLYKKKRSKG